MRSHRCAMQDFFIALLDTAGRSHPRDRGALSDGNGTAANAGEQG
jgi:hypothetical protein